MKKELSIIIIATLLSVAAFAQIPVGPGPGFSAGMPEVDFQTCGGQYVLDHYDFSQPVPFGILDKTDAQDEWAAEGCTDFVFKPAGDGNYLGFGYRIEFAQ